MNSTEKTKEELISELTELRQENASLKAKIETAIETDYEIQKRKLAEEAVIASEIRYRRLFESAKDGILILDAETGMVKDVNPFLIDLLGYSFEQFIGKSIWELGFLKDIIDNFDNFLELQQKEYIRYDDLPLKTSGGRLINVEFVSNVYLVDHKKVIQCNIRDITERKQAEVSLKESEEKYRFLADNSSDNIWTRDLNLKYTYISPSILRLIGYTVEEEMERTIDMSYSPKTLQLISQVFTEEMELEAMGTADPLRNRTIELEAYQKDGSIIFLETSMTFLRDDKLIPYGIYGITRNITERKQEEEALLESNKDLNNQILVSIELNRALEEKQNELKEQNEELKNANTDLLRFNRATVGRELTMIELKKEINDLLKQLGKSEKYKIVE